MLIESLKDYRCLLFTKWEKEWDRAAALQWKSAYSRWDKQIPVASSALLKWWAVNTGIYHLKLLPYTYTGTKLDYLVQESYLTSTFTLAAKLQDNLNLKFSLKTEIPGQICGVILPPNRDVESEVEEGRKWRKMYAARPRCYLVAVIDRSSLISESVKVSDISSCNM